MRTRKKAWVGRDSKQVKKLGEKDASWYVYWNDPDGRRRTKSCGPGSAGKKLADREADKIHAQLITGTYEAKPREKWSDFRPEFDRLVLDRLERAATHVQVKNVIAHFERIICPVRMSSITNKSIQEYISARQLEAGKKPKSTVAPATINKELRTLKGILRKACRWGYLPKMPDIEFVRELDKGIVYVTTEHFEAIYSKCKVAEFPSEQGFDAAAWWQAIVVMAYMTGWRIGELLTVERSDVDLAAGTATTRAENNKGGRTETTNLHPIVIVHLEAIPSLSKMLFPFDGDGRALYDQFAKIQAAAGIKLPCRIPRKHECTDACQFYGFHDFRRAFATENALNLTPVQVQAQMRHRSFSTTMRYVNMAKQRESIVEKLHVPSIAKQA